MEIKCQLDATEVFYCRSYCFLNMFRAPLCPASGAQEYYTVVTACGISWCGFQVVGLVMCSVCRMLQHPANEQTSNLKNHSTNYHRQQPLYNTLELLMMGIVVPETCWASNEICNKKTSVASSWHFISQYWLHTFLGVPQFPYARINLR